MENNNKKEDYHREQNETDVVDETQVCREDRIGHVSKQFYTGLVAGN